MTERKYCESHIYTVLARIGNLRLIPEELDRVKKSTAYRLMCITDGECSLFLSGESVKLQKNDLCFFCPGDIYRTLPIRDMRVVNLYFSFDRADLDTLFGVSTLDYSNVVKRYRITDFDFLNRPFVLKGFADGVSLAESILNLPVESPLEQKARDVLLEKLMLDVLNLHSRRESDREEGSRALFLSDLTRYIRVNIHEKLSCRDIARRFGYHPNYLNAIVNSALGITLRELITEEKIKSATDELISSDKPIAEIAQDYAFCDSSHFDRAYFSATGLKPSAVRAAARR